MSESMKDYLPLDPKYFKAFMAAADTLNFTTAAADACMTQSGISQHIARLEEQVGLPLFKRIGKKVALTETGKGLVGYIKDHTYSTETFLDSVRTHNNAIAGLVSYAMPPSCLYSPHFPLLLERRKQYPGITLDVTLAPNQEVVQMVLEDRIDFGFITSAIDNQLITNQLFCREEYILVGSDPFEIEGLSHENILQRHYITYPGSDVYFDFWFKHHFPDDITVPKSMLPVSGRINSISGAIDMVAGGLGLSVFPRHCVDGLLGAGKVFEFVNTLLPPLLNDIHIIQVANYQYPRRIAQVISWFFEMKKQEFCAETIGLAMAYQ